MVKIFSKDFIFICEFCLRAHARVCKHTSMLSCLHTLKSKKRVSDLWTVVASDSELQEGGTELGSYRRVRHVLSH